jgi:hypothetical protein
MDFSKYLISSPSFDRVETFRPNLSVYGEVRVGLDTDGEIVSVVDIPDELMSFVRCYFYDRFKGTDIKFGACEYPDYVDTITPHRTALARCHLRCNSCRLEAYNSKSVFVHPLISTPGIKLLDELNPERCPLVQLRRRS